MRQDMSDVIPDMAEILAEMRESFLKTLAVKIQRLNELQALLESEGHLSPEQEEEFLREVHSLKGMGATFQMPLVSQFSKAFESYLKKSDHLSMDMSDDIAKYLERLEEISNSKDSQADNLLEKWVDGLATGD